MISSFDKLESLLEIVSGLIPISSQKLPPGLVAVDPVVAPVDAPVSDPPTTAVPVNDFAYGEFVNPVIKSWAIDVVVEFDAPAPGESAVPTTSIAKGAPMYEPSEEKYKTRLLFGSATRYPPSAVRVIPVFSPTDAPRYPAIPCLISANGAVVPPPPASVTAPVPDEASCVSDPVVVPTPVMSATSASVRVVSANRPSSVTKPASAKTFVVPSPCATASSTIRFVMPPVVLPGGVLEATVPALTAACTNSLGLSFPSCNVEAIALLTNVFAAGDRSAYPGIIVWISGTAAFMPPAIRA